MNEREGRDLHKTISEAIDNRLGDGWQGSQIKTIVKKIVLEEIEKVILPKKKKIT